MAINFSYKSTEKSDATAFALIPAEKKIFQANNYYLLPFLTLISLGSMQFGYALANNN